MRTISKTFFIIVFLSFAIAAFFLVSTHFSLAQNEPEVEVLGEQTGIIWGVDFSQSQAEYLGLDWKETYSAVIRDLGVRHIKLHTNWDWIEGENDKYFFNDTDWQLREAKRNDVKLIYVVGMKTGRWP